YLAGCVAVRRGDGGGAISLDDRNRYVSRATAGRGGSATLDPTEGGGGYADRAGACDRRQGAGGLTAEGIIGLAVAQRRGRGRPGRSKGLARLPDQTHVA